MRGVCGGGERGEVPRWAGGSRVSKARVWTALGSQGWGGYGMCCRIAVETLIGEEKGARGGDRGRGVVVEVLVWGELKGGLRLCPW